MPRALIVYAGYVNRIPGGVVNHVLHLRQGLRARRWEVDVLSLESVKSPWRYLPHLIERILNSVYSPWGFYARYAVGRRLLKAAANGGGPGQAYDLVIFEDIYSAFPMSAPALCVLHALISDNLQSVALPPKRIDDAKRHELRLLRGTTYPIATVSKEYRDAVGRSLNQNAAEVPPMSVATPAVDTSPYPFPPLARASTVLQMVAVGYLYARKNFGFLSDVLSRLKAGGDSFHLTMIGDGPQRTELIAQFSRMDLDAHVTWAGLVPSARMPDVLQAFHLMLHPSLKESFAYALLEAKLAGVYTMTSTLDVPGEFCDDMLPLDPSVWAARIREIRTAVLSGQWLSATRQSIDTLRRAYSIDRMTEEILHLAGTLSKKVGRRPEEYTTLS